MRLGRIPWIVILAAALAFSLGGPARAADGLESGLAGEGFRLTIVAENNLAGLDVLLAGEQPASVDCQIVLAYEDLELRIPLAQDGVVQWGLFGQAAGWVSGTGETPLFLLNAGTDRLPTNRELYDLSARSEQFDRFGLFGLRRFALGDWEAALRAEAFCVTGYLHQEMTGQGSLEPDLDGTQKIGAYAMARRIRLAPGNPPGFGVGLAWETRLRFDSGVKVDLRLANLPGLVYFPALEEKCIKIDSERVTIGPDGEPQYESQVTSFRENVPEWIALPLAVEGRCTLEVMGGLLGLEIARIGPVQDFWFSYARGLGRSFTLTAGYSPVMGDVRLACSWRGGQVSISISPQVMGLAFSLG